MIIDCIADLHGNYPELEGGDLLIVAGDLTASDRSHQYLDFLEWLKSLDYCKKVVIPGNHDGLLSAGRWESVSPYEYTGDPRIDYLCDSGTEFEYEEQFEHPASTDRVSIDVLCYQKKKLKIWGSPWTLTFPGINPLCTAFTGDEMLLAEKSALIPHDIDILVTHGPPHGIMDEVDRGRFTYRRQIENVGSLSLSKAVARIRPKLHIYGHIHGGYGQRSYLLHEWIKNNCRDTVFVNCSHMNEDYEPVNKPIRVVL
jgi:hypothetical protein